MADYPALNLWTDAYLADTLDLSLEEHGAYLKLMMIAWRSPECGVPDDDRRIATMLGVTHSRWVKVLRPKMERFWAVSGKFLTQKRLTKERAYLNNKREQQRRAGKSSALKRKGTEPTNVGDPLEQNSQREANEAPNETATPLPLPIREETPTDVGAKKDIPDVPDFLRRTKDNGHDKRGTRLPKDWWPNEQNCEFARSLGLDPAEIAPEHVDYWASVPGQKGVKLDWNATWRNRCRDLAKRATERVSQRPKPGGVVAAVRESMAERERGEQPQ